MINIKETVKNELTQFVLGDDRVLSVYLLGSFVNGNFRKNSDIDVAILLLPGCDISSMDLLTIGSELSIKIGRRVDIGMITNKNLIYASEVFYKGELLFTKSEDENNSIRANLLGLYLNFNEERKGILDAYRT